jgi:hypothetical protein
MPIRIWTTTQGYEAEVIPPHGDGKAWKSEHALPLGQIVDALLAHGCHQSDISDELYTLDPEWLSR